ncbi:zinc ribbon domain-containing protein [Streptomyces sp. HC307]|uniref:zinc ribbon domain-containing protein n=1 Tax=Streptomyces flavusporus TaxID=3385496 RepID=UPI00391704D4
MLTSSTSCSANMRCCGTRSASCPTAAPPQRRPRPGRRPLGRGPGHRRPSHGHLPGRPAVDGSQGHGPHPQHLHVPDGARPDRRPHRHLAAEAGIAVVTVPPRNTSRHCPQCLTALRHRKVPDRPTTAGWKRAICPGRDCGWQGERDHGAWQRIAARGLTHQAKTVTDRATGQMAIRTVVDTLETKAVITPTTQASLADRSETGPTRRRNTRPAAWRASVRMDTHQRTAGHCPAQPTGTRA